MSDDDSDEDMPEGCIAATFANFLRMYFPGCVE
jgi:hypothetical protein